jgi:hypothetical protein
LKEIQWFFEHTKNFKNSPDRQFGQNKKYMFYKLYDKSNCQVSSILMKPSPIYVKRSYNDSMTNLDSGMPKANQRKFDFRQKSIKSSDLTKTSIKISFKSSYAMLLVFIVSKQR